MKTRRHHGSEDDLTITLRNTRSKTSMNRRENSEPIPIDLIYEILSRLPAKSIARCRCVSKLWASILCRPDFTDLFLTRSSARPQLLFAYQNNGEIFFLSSPQPDQSPDVNLSRVGTNRLTHFPCNSYCDSSGPVCGLFCLAERRIANRRKETVLAICNPSTGQSLPLPIVNTRKVGVRSLLGYDPIDKQFKVLSMTWSSYESECMCEEHRILTLGTRILSWRMVECCIPHYFPQKDICINGVLYYPSINKSTHTCVIVCFDVKSEKFRFINVVEDFFRVVRDGTLINYNGKLGLLVSERSCWVYGTSGNIELCVLEDAEKHEWSKYTYVLPSLWQNQLGLTYLRFVGMTRRKEIVLSPYTQIVPYLIYYNIERDMITKVGIQGIEEVNILYTFLDYVEDVNLMQVL